MEKTRSYVYGIIYTKLLQTIPDKRTRDTLTYILHRLIQDSGNCNLEFIYNTLSNL